MRRTSLAHRSTGQAAMLCCVPLLVTAIGCGGKPASVSGVVTIDGRPLDRGNVSFSPSAGGQMAVGTIQGDGSYQLMTNREKGLELGEYKVSVVSREMTERKGGGPPLQGKYIAPRRYGATKTSGLSFEIERGQNTIDIELSSESQEADGIARRKRR